MLTDADFINYQNLVQQHFEAIEAQMLSLMDSVEKQAQLINQLVDGTPAKGDAVANSNLVPRPGALSEINPINKEDNI